MQVNQAREAHRPHAYQRQTQPRTAVRQEPPSPSSSAARAPFQRNATLVVAQLLGVAQGLAAVMIGIYFMWELATNNFASALGAPAAINGLFFNSVFPYAMAILLAGLVLTIAGLRAGHPSQFSRWLVATWEVILLVTILAALTRTALNLGSLSVLAVASSGVQWVSPYVVLTAAALVIYGLVLDPATYRAFARQSPPT